MKRSYLASLFLMIPLFAFLMTGCSTLKSIYGDRFHISRSKPRDFSNGDNSLLKNKILLAPITNMAGIKDEKTDTLMETLVTLLKKDESILVSALTEFESLSPTDAEMGIVTDPALINRAEEMGMNALVTLVLEPLDYTVDKGIIWPFNKFKGEYNVSMVVNAVDITSGMVIFSFKESEKVKVGRVPEGQETPIPLDEETLDDVLYELLEKQASILLDVLAGRQWKGKISLDGEKIKISGGKDIGVTTGSVFEVFTKGEALKSATGKEYYIEGPKAGEIKVTDVMEDYSFAAPIGKVVFEDGQIITLKAE